MPKRVKKIGITELFIAGGCATLAISGFALGQTRQPYDMAEIRYCPRSANNPDVLPGIVTERNRRKKIVPEKDFFGRSKPFKEDKTKYYDPDGQRKLNEKYCFKPRFVLFEEWQRYGKYNANIPYKGDAISLVQVHEKENSNYILFSLLGLLGLWGVTGCVVFRVNKLRRRDLEFSEEEKTLAHSLFLDKKNERDLNEYGAQLDLSIAMEHRANKHQQVRERLGLYNPEFEDYKGQLENEVIMKRREAELSKIEKEIAANLKDAATAHLERQQATDKMRASGDIKNNSSSSESPNNAKQDIINELKEHEGGWIWEIIEFQKPLWILGAQGSGKSTLAAAIAMVRAYCLGMEFYQLIDRHATRNLSEAWLYLQPKEIAESLEDIAEGLDGARGRWIEKINSGENLAPSQVLVDEFTNLSQEPDTKDPAAAFFRSSLSDPRKAKEYIIGLAHYFTVSARGGSGGTKQGSDEGTITIKRKTRNGKVPLPHAVVNGLFDEQGEPIEDKKVTIPDWFRPERLAKRLGIKPNTATDKKKAAASERSATASFPAPSAKSNSNIPTPTAPPNFDDDIDGDAWDSSQDSHQAQIQDSHQAEENDPSVAPDWFPQIINWVILEDPSDKVIAQKFKDFSGITPNQQAIDIIKEQARQHAQQIDVNSDIGF